ncbi:RcpC/CpaB family pilus assembly protein [Actinoallomurus iriomotensis]|uniref:RcpC/CpaB family pilus assembly protein n=1 Tax=Actinoallomurus iriomotensis TaxID=478107 RepID=UPI002552CBB7|nr:RcpC/CpaB family pilus assembly protein [Actinoallomurus iriomotensis]
MRAALSRHRRLLAAVFAAAAAALGLAAARPHSDGVRVWVAARDLPAGATLTARDVAARFLPRAAVPSGLVRAAAGRTLSGPIRRGEPLTDARLRSAGLLDETDPAAVATPIRLADAAVARLLRPGDRVDVLAARSDNPMPARTVASSVPILAVPKPALDPDEGALIVVRTDRPQAAALARAATDSRLSITILGR